MNMHVMNTNLLKGIIVFPYLLHIHYRNPHHLLKDDYKNEDSSQLQSFNFCHSDYDMTHVRFTS